MLVMENIQIQVAEFNSELQKKSIELRYKVLREPLGLVYTAEQLAEEKDEIHIVAVLHDKVAGIVVLKKSDNNTLKMRQVAVDPELQQSGIGKKMVLFSEQWAKDNQYRKIELHARDTAKEFYLKMDYKITGDEFKEVGIPHFKMTKVIK
jgi:predicted GNAT family N-acyltransferase